MKKAKIMIIHHSGLLGGAGISLLNMIEAIKNEYEIVIYLPNRPNDMRDEAIKRGHNTITYDFRLGSISHYSGGFKKYSPKTLVKFLLTYINYKYWKSNIGNMDPDLVIVNSKTLCWMSRLFKNKNFKTACFVRETIPPNKSLVWHTLQQFYLNKFSRVFFISSFDQKEENLTKTSTAVIPNSLDITRYEDKLGKKKACEFLKIDHNKFNLLYVGGVNKLKGFDVAIKALCELNDPNINLIIAGYDFRENLKRTGTKRTNNKKNNNFFKDITETLEGNPHSNIKFIGIQKDISTAYSSCDLLLIPINEPHQARPAFEIACQKKTMIISDFSNVREYVKDGYNGLTFEPGNHRDLAKKIRILQERKELRTELGEKNYRHMVKTHSIENVSKIISDNIHDLIFNDNSKN